MEKNAGSLRQSKTPLGESGRLRVPGEKDCRVMVLPSSVSGIHGDENPEAWLDEDIASLERDASVFSLQRLLDRHDLLSHYGEHLRKRKISVRKE